tara:strand:+ start:122 stop:337 length:216 start_codon:yes stop_codon:yes gene_type:complete
MMKKKKVKRAINMKPLNEPDPCPTCLYGKARNQHNVPKAVDNFNRVTPKEAFGVSKSKSKSKSKPVTKSKK